MEYSDKQINRSGRLSRSEIDQLDEMRRTKANKSDVDHFYGFRRSGMSTGLSYDSSISYSDESDYVAALFDSKTSSLPTRGHLTEGVFKDTWGTYTPFYNADMDNYLIVSSPAPNFGTVVLAQSKATGAYGFVARVPLNEDFTGYISCIPVSSHLTVSTTANFGNTGSAVISGVVAKKIDPFVFNPTATNLSSPMFSNSHRYGVPLIEGLRLVTPVLESKRVLITDSYQYNQEDAYLVGTSTMTTGQTAVYPFFPLQGGVEYEITLNPTNPAVASTATIGFTTNNWTPTGLVTGVTLVAGYSYVVQPSLVPNTFLKGVFTNSSAVNFIVNTTIGGVQIVVRLRHKGAYLPGCGTDLSLARVSAESTMLPLINVSHKSYFEPDETLRKQIYLQLEILPNLNSTCVVRMINAMNHLGAPLVSLLSEDQTYYRDLLDKAKLFCDRSLTSAEISRVAKSMNRNDDIQTGDVRLKGEASSRKKAYAASEELKIDTNPLSLRRQTFSKHMALSPQVRAGNFCRDEIFNGQVEQFHTPKVVTTSSTLHYSDRAMTCVTLSRDRSRPMELGRISLLRNAWSYLCSPGEPAMYSLSMIKEDYEQLFFSEFHTNEIIERYVPRLGYHSPLELSFHSLSPDVSFYDCHNGELLIIQTSSQKGAPSTFSYYITPYQYSTKTFATPELIMDLRYNIATHDLQAFAVDLLISILCGHHVSNLQGYLTLERIYSLEIWPDIYSRTTSSLLTLPSTPSDLISEYHKPYVRITKPSLSNTPDQDLSFEEVPDFRRTKAYAASRDRVPTNPATTARRKNFFTMDPDVQSAPVKKVVFKENYPNGLESIFSSLTTPFHVQKDMLSAVKNKYLKKNLPYTDPVLPVVIGFPAIIGEGSTLCAVMISSKPPKDKTFFGEPLTTTRIQAVSAHNKDYTISIHASFKLTDAQSAAIDEAFFYNHQSAIANSVIYLEFITPAGVDVLGVSFQASIMAGLQGAPSGSVFSGYIDPNPEFNFVRPAAMDAQDIIYKRSYESTIPFLWGEKDNRQYPPVMFYTTIDAANCTTLEQPGISAGSFAVRTVGALPSYKGFHSSDMICLLMWSTSVTPSSAAYYNVASQRAQLSSIDTSYGTVLKTLTKKETSGAIIIPDRYVAVIMSYSKRTVGRYADEMQRGLLQDVANNLYRDINNPDIDQAIVKSLILPTDFDFGGYTNFTKPNLPAVIYQSTLNLVHSMVESDTPIPQNVIRAAVSVWYGYVFQTMASTLVLSQAQVLMSHPRFQNDLRDLQIPHDKLPPADLTMLELTAVMGASQGPIDYYIHLLAAETFTSKALALQARSIFPNTSPAFARVVILSAGLPFNNSLVDGMSTIPLDVASKNISGFNCYIPRPMSISASPENNQRRLTAKNTERSTSQVKGAGSITNSRKTPSSMFNPIQTTQQDPEIDGGDDEFF